MYFVHVLPLLWSISVVSSQGNVSSTDAPIPVFQKCCSNENEVLDFRTGSCVQTLFPFAQNDYHVLPAFISQSQQPQQEDDPSSSTYNLPEFNLGSTYLPKCDESTQDLKKLLFPGNDASAASSFFIDDLGITDKAFSLIDLEDTEQYVDFCLDVAFNGKQFMGTLALVCATKDEVACRSRPCVKFCCKEGSYYDTGSKNCEVDPNQTFPELHFLSSVKDTPVKVKPKSVKYFFGGVPECKHHEYSQSEFKLYDTGEIFAGGKLQNYTGYCLERHGEYNPNISVDTSTFPLVLWVCAPTDPFSFGHLEYVKIVDLTIIPILNIVSLVFLGLLFIFVYIKNRQKLFGVMTLSLISMLFCFYLFLIVAKFAGEVLVSSYSQICIAIGLLLQFFYLSAIFWLNAMSFDIWSTFRQMRRLPDQNQPQGWRHKRFKWYALYSWVCPFLIIVVTIIMQFLPKEATHWAVVPNIGKNRCFLESTWAMVYYLNIIIGPLVCFNIIFFVASMWNLLCGVWADKSGDPVLRAQNKTRYKTVIKMFFAMGITWLSEAISHAIDWAYGPIKFRTVSTVFNIINALQGVILFCVIVFDPPMIQMIKQRLLGRTGEPARNHKSSVSARSDRLSTTSAPTPIRKLSRLLPEKLRKKSENDDSQVIELKRAASPQQPREI